MEAEAERARRHPSTILESPVALETSLQPPQPQGTPTPKAAPTKDWMTAEKEKELLYQRAVENVNRVQGGARSSIDVSPGFASTNVRVVYSRIFSNRPRMAPSTQHLQRAATPQRRRPANRRSAGQQRRKRRPVCSSKLKLPLCALVVKKLSKQRDARPRSTIRPHPALVPLLVPAAPTFQQVLHCTLKRCLPSTVPSPRAPRMDNLSLRAHPIQQRHLSPRKHLLLPRVHMVASRHPGATPLQLKRRP